MPSNDMSEFTTPMYGLLSLPYVPLRKRVGGRKRRYLYKYNIAYAETFRGKDDDIPTLLFLAPLALVQEVCQHLHKLMDGKVRELRVSSERACVERNGKCDRRISVQVEGLDEDFLSLREFGCLMVAKMAKLCHCTVRRYKIETFLNL